MTAFASQLSFDLLQFANWWLNSGKIIVGFLIFFPRWCKLSLNFDIYIVKCKIEILKILFCTKFIKISTIRKIISHLFLVIAAINFSDAIILDCTYRVGSFAYVDNAYVCDARVLIFSSNDSVIFAVTQNHLYNRTNDNVNALQITNQRLVSVPKQITKFYQNVQALYLRNNSLTHISSAELQPFPFLTHLTLWDNKLQVLDGDLFKFTPNIQLIDFDNNQLIHIGLDILNPLWNLKTARFSGNKCINISLVSASPSDIASFKLELSTKCPPSMDMYLMTLLSQRALVEKIEEIVANKTESIVERVGKLEVQLANITSETPNQ